MNGVNYVKMAPGIVLAAVANVAIGALWYSPLLFGSLYQQHMAAMGIVPDASKMMIATLGSFIAALVIGAVMSCFMARLQITSCLKGALFGAEVWLGFVATVTVQPVLYLNWPVVLFLINNGYNLACFVVMGKILAYFTKRSMA